MIFTRGDGGDEVAGSMQYTPTECCLVQLDADTFIPTSDCGFMMSGSVGCRDRDVFMSVLLVTTRTQVDTPDN